MKKTMSLIFMLVLLCFTLTGCMGAIFEVTINEDCSGTFVVTSGYTKEAIATLEEMANGEKYEYDTTFEHNGIKYYGTKDSKEFKNLDELLNLLAEDSENGVSSPKLTIKKDAEGSFIFTMPVPNVDDPTINLNSEEIELTEEEKENLMAQMAVVLKFTFPYNVVQLSGPTEGITIENNTLTIDAIKMSEAVTPDTLFKFKASKTGETPSIPEIDETPATPSVIAPNFTDISEDKWYYNAVSAMANGGLIAGIGDNKFNPDGTLTIAQFCQILARAKNRSTGTDENGYWAGIAIYECVDMGYIVSNGDITPENYNVPITREAAVAAMYLASQANFLNATPKGIKLEDIPDNAQISEVYKEHIVDAYNFGITNGNDDKLTFNPQGSLTRAQVCQLFYNLDWTKPAEV